MIHSVNISIHFGRNTDMREIRAAEKTVATLVGNMAQTKVILYGTFIDDKGCPVFGNAGVVVLRFGKTRSKTAFWAKVDGAIMRLTVDEITSANVCAKTPL